MCASPKVRISIFLAALFLLILPSAYSQSPSDDPFAEILAKLGSMEERIKKIEQDQQEVLVREEKILAELDRIRIWVRRQ